MRTSSVKRVLSVTYFLYSASESHSSYTPDLHWMLTHMNIMTEIFPSPFSFDFLSPAFLLFVIPPRFSGVTPAPQGSSVLLVSEICLYQASAEVDIFVSVPVLIPLRAVLQWPTYINI